MDGQIGNHTMKLKRFPFDLEIMNRRNKPTGADTKKPAQLPGGGGGVRPLNGVWFFDPSALNKVCNFKSVCPYRDLNPSSSGI